MVESFFFFFRARGLAINIDNLLEVMAGPVFATGCECRLHLRGHTPPHVTSK